MSPPWSVRSVAPSPEKRRSLTERLYEGEYGRIRTAFTGPDDHLYLATSNRDGRGSPVASDDRILRIRPD